VSGSDSSIRVLSFSMASQTVISARVLLWKDAADRSNPRPGQAPLLLRCRRPMGRCRRHVPRWPGSDSSIRVLSFSMASQTVISARVLLWKSWRAFRLKKEAEEKGLYEQSEFDKEKDKTNFRQYEDASDRVTRRSGC
jgi:hypothetical protein